MSKRFLAVVTALMLFLPFFASASAASGSFTVTAFRGCADNSVNIQFSGDAIPTYGELSLHNTSDDWTYGFSPFSPVAGVYSPVARNWDVAAVRIPGLEGIISLFVPGCAPGGVTGPAVSETVQVGDPEPVELHACITYRDDETQEVHPFTFSSYEEAEAAGFIFAEDGSVTLTPGMARGARLVNCDAPADPGPQPEANVAYGEWEGGEATCEVQSVTQTRTVTTTSYVLSADGTQWVLGTPVVTTETRTDTLTAEELAACEGEEPEPGAWTVINPVLVCVLGGVDVTFTVSGSENVPAEGMLVDVQVHPVPSEGGVPTASEFGTIAQGDEGPYTVEVRSEDLSSGTYLVRVFKVGTSDFVESEATVTCIGDDGEEPAPSPTPTTPSPTPTGTVTPETPAVTPSLTEVPTEVPTQEPTKEPIVPAPGGTNTPTTQAVDGMPNTGSGPARNSDTIALAALGAASVALMLLGGGIVVRRKL